MTAQSEGTRSGRKRAAGARTPVASVVAGDVVELAPERKLLTNIIKIVAYQAESDLVQLLAPHYRRAADEGRTPIQSAPAATAILKATTEELCVTLVPLSSSQRSKSIVALCEDLNRKPVVFPGTRLRLRYAVQHESRDEKGTIQFGAV